MTLLNRAALFDMDKTLLRVNSGNLYLRWRFSRHEASIRQALQFSFWLLKYKLGMANPTKISVEALKSLAGKKEADIRKELGAWYKANLAPHITDYARREVEKKRAEGFTLAIVSASIGHIVEPLAKDLNISHVLCSELDVRDGALTGGYIPPLCYGEGKVQLAHSWAYKHNVDLRKSVFYTDSYSDLPLLREVGEPCIINPDPRLRRLAKKEGWRMERWK